jgi:DNA polymerase-3 subunit epsilon
MSRSFFIRKQRTLSAAYQFYCNKELENAHSSKADTVATFEVLKAQLDRYSDLENNVEKLADFSSYNNMVDFAGRIIYDENGIEIFNFGKHKGKPVELVLREEPSYYSWMMNGDFPLYTKKILTEIKLRSFGKGQQ